MKHHRPARVRPPRPAVVERVTRRSLMFSGLTWALAGSAATSWRSETHRRDLPLLPRVNGGINVQPLRRLDTVHDFTPPLIIPELVDLQLRALYELGFSSMRITISFNNFGPDFFAAIPYVRAARALGIDVLGILGQFGFGFDLVQALAVPAVRGQVLQAYLEIFGQPPAPVMNSVRTVGAFSMQVLNEPTHEYGLESEDYVHYFLIPIYEELKRRQPELTVVAAAAVGNRDGVLRARAMLEAGLENHCDRFALHVYDRSLIPRIARLSPKPTWITESGTIGTDQHLEWFTGVFPQIFTLMPQVQRIFWFQLFDFGVNRHRLIDIFENEEGYEAQPASRLLMDYLTARVETATGGRAHARYEDLIPDITEYFPNADDFGLVEAIELPLENSAG